MGHNTVWEILIKLAGKRIVIIIIIIISTAFFSHTVSMEQRPTKTASLL